jgi:hypothetical protein
VAAHVELSGELELVRERPWGAVWRVQARRGVAWVKACAPVQAFEPRLTHTLANRWPALLPEVLAVDGERGWLLLGDAGERLGFGGGPEPWLALLPAYAELQLGELTYVREHLDGGVPDRGLDGLPALYEAMLAHDLPVSAADRARLRRFEPTFVGLCEELAAAGGCETMQHDDLHGNNVYPYAGSARILDWGDACIGQSFLTLFVLFLHLEEMEGLAPGDPWFDRLRDAYLEPWGGRDLREAFALAQRIGPFAHAFKELRVLDAIDTPGSRFAPDLTGILTRCVANTT